MPRDALDPLRVPVEFWSRDDVRRALAGRDIGELFRLLRRHAGASQTQIGIAVGLAQGYVSRIMTGRRVTAIDLLERIVDGLDAPDSARTLLGLASSQASVAQPANPGIGKSTAGSWQAGIAGAVELSLTTTTSSTCTRTRWGTATSARTG